MPGRESSTQFGPSPVPVIKEFQLKNPNGAKSHIPQRRSGCKMWRFDRRHLPLAMIAPLL